MINCVKSLVVSIPIVMVQRIGMKKWLAVVAFISYAIGIWQSPVNAHVYKAKEFYKTYVCYADDPRPQYLYFSSKTSYSALYNEANFEPPPDECKPIAIWFLVRHGIRYTTHDSNTVFSNMNELRHQILHNHIILQQGSLCDEDIDNLVKWKMINVPLNESDNLTDEGYHEILQLATRFRKRFPEIFEKKFASDIFQFRHTDHLKNRRSAIAFAEGIFGHDEIEKNEEKICPMPEADDLLVKLKPECKRAVMRLNDPDHRLLSKNNFRNVKIFDDVVRSVSERLGFSQPLPRETVERIYNLCRYSKAWHFNDLSPWCASFTPDELKVFEYMNDLAYYYNSGPGLEVNRQFGCPLLQDMIQQFQAAVQEEVTGHLSKLYFGHSTTLFNLLSVLGTHVDRKHITADNYEEMQDRKWRTSLMDPFGSNFVAVLLRCSSGEKYRVKFYLNESNFRFEGCNGSICGWEHFQKMYNATINPKVCNTNYCDTDFGKNDMFVFDDNIKKESRINKEAPEDNMKAEETLTTNVYETDTEVKGYENIKDKVDINLIDETKDKSNYIVVNTDSLQNDRLKLFKQSPDGNNVEPEGVFSQSLSSDILNRLKDTELLIFFFVLTCLALIFMSYVFRRVCRRKRRYNKLFLTL